MKGKKYTFLYSKEEKPDLRERVLKLVLILYDEREGVEIFCDLFMYCCFWVWDRAAEYAARPTLLKKERYISLIILPFNIFD